MRRVVAVALLGCMVLSGSALPASAATSEPVLSGGFTVAPGTRLVGPVFPLVSVRDGQVVGATAVLNVDTDAVTAINRYATQASHLGYRQQEAISCRPDSFGPPDGGLVCHATFLGEGRNFSVELRVCGACSQPVSVMQVFYGRSAESPPGSAAITPLPPDAPTASLTAAQRRQAHETPTAGNMAPPGMGRFALVPGSKPLEPAATIGVCSGYAFDAVVEVVDDPARVWNPYVRQVRGTDSRTFRVRFRGGDAIVYNDTSWGT